MKKFVFAIPLLFVFVLCGWGQRNGNSAVEEIIVICKTHFDIGYTHRVADIVHYYQTEMIDRAFKAMATSEDLPKEQQFAWTLPGWVLSKTMEDWEGQTEERRRMLDDKFRSGQIISHALPFTFISDICGLEELTRGLNFSSSLNRKYGLPLSRSGKLTDEPSHTGALVTVLANADVKFLHIGCNWPSGFVKTPGLFWWEGPDGSRILTLYSPIYGTSYGLYPKAWVGPNDPMVGVNLLPAEDWPYKVWPAILVTGDNSGPPSGERIKAMFEEVKMKMPGVKVRMGTMDDFYEAIVKENPELPVVKADMPDTWIHGIMCDPRGIRLYRDLHFRIPAVEMLNTQLAVWGTGVSDIKREIAESYEKIALYGEHTWGGSKSISVYGEAFRELSAETYEDLENSWEDKTDYVRDAFESTRTINASNLEVLAQKVKSHAPSYVVYNPLPWSRSGWVKIGDEMRYAKDIPAGGYRVFPAKKSEAKTEGPSDKSDFIENDFFKITFDPERGGIVSLIDKRTGREWADPNADRTLGQYMNERFTLEQTKNYTISYQRGRGGNWLHPGIYKPGMVSGKEVPYRMASSANGTLKISDDGGRQTAECFCPGNETDRLPASVLRVSLYEDQPFIDMEMTVLDKKKDNWPEADWFCLPFRVKDPEFRVYRQLGVMNPETDILAGANRHLYAAEYGVTITGPDGAGIAVCPVDHPLVSLGEPGCWKYSEDYVPNKPVVYLNLFNNQWNTNFRYWYSGSWSSKVRLWTIEEGTAPEERTRFFTVRALEARNPLQAVSVEDHKGKGMLPLSRQGVRLSRQGVIVTAFGPDPDGNSGTLLRVWEQAGTSGELVITLPEGMNVSQAVPVNLRGEKKGNPLVVSGRKIKLNLPAYAPASFILN